MLVIRAISQETMNTMCFWCCDALLAQAHRSSAAQMSQACLEEEARLAVVLDPEAEEEAWEPAMLLLSR